MPPPARAECDGRVDDVGSARHATELAGLAGALVVERLDDDLFGTQEAGEARLAAPVPPYLTDGSRRNRERVAGLESAGEHEPRRR